MRRSLHLGLSLVAIGVGVIHLRMALRAVFVFREGEPIWSWVIILAGPGSTLFAALLGWFRPQIGGIWLLAGSVISLLALTFLEGGVTANVVQLVWRIAGPMAAIGLAFLLLNRAS